MQQSHAFRLFDRKYKTRLIFSLALTGLCLSAYASPSFATERVFYIQAIEHKGKTSVKMEPYPAKPLANSAGKKTKPANRDGIWAVEAYGFSPAQVTVMQGDEVILHFIGINGGHHSINIEGVKTIEPTRGTMTSVRFTADKPGLIPFVCADHGPNMNGQIVVLKK